MATYSGIPFPDIDPVLFQWGWIIIRWYSLAYIFGLLAAWGLARKMSKASNSPFSVLKIDDFLLWATIGVVVGGRLGYVFFYNFRYFLEFPAQIFAVWQGGMSFHGGLLGVIIATLLFAVKKKIPVLSMGDILVCVAPIGLFLGRLANFINGELYGRISQSVPWVMVFPGGGDLPRHPSQLYEAGVEGLFLFIVLNTLWWFFPRYRYRSGFFTGLFFLLYGLGRFGLEYFREPDVQLGFFSGGLTMGQLLCIPMIVIGIAFLIYASPRAIINRLEKGK